MIHRIENYKPFENQQAFHRAPQRHKLYGGSMGGGKTRTIGEEIVQLMIDYPGNRGFIGRKHFADFRITTYLTLTEKVLAQHIKAGTAKENKGDKTFDFWNGSRLFYGGITSSGKKNEKLFSSEFGAIAIDEAFEMSEGEFKKLGTRLRHSLPDGTHPPFYFLMASNPAQNWLKTRFILRPNKATDIFIPALPKDNPHNPEDYEEYLVDLFRGDEQMIEAFVKGSWNSIGATNALVTMDDVQKCINVPISRNGEYKRFTTVDSGGEGDDLTVVVNWEAFIDGDKRAYKWVNYEHRPRTTTPEIVGLADVQRVKNESTDVFFDPIGEGRGAHDVYWEMAQGKAFEVDKIDFRAKPPFDPDHYYNLRAEAYWMLRLAIKNKTICLPDHDGLHQELCAITWKSVGSTKGTKILISSKEDIKSPEVLGCSPDHADNAAMAMIGAELASTVKKVNKDRWRSGESEESYNWMVA